MKKKTYPARYPVPVRFSRSVVVGDFVFVSGCSGQTLQTFHVASNDVMQQTEVALEKIRGALAEAGTSMDNIVKSVLYLKRMEDYDKAEEKRQEHLQAARLALEQELSDRRVELADAETVAQYVVDLRNTLSESSLAERKSFVRSFVKEVKVTGDEVLLTYTIPMLPGGMIEEKLPVLSIVHGGGR